MHVAVVVNPRSGKFRRHRFDAKAIEGLVARVASTTGVTARVELTDAIGGGRAATRRVLEAGAEVVVAWGGDGTINEVASTLASTGVPLGIVRGGSGNGLARELGIPRAPEAALGVAFGGRVRTIDLGTLDGGLFVNLAGFGIDAVVAHAFNAHARGRALLGYVRLTLGELMRYRPQRYRVRWEGGAFDGRALTVAVANSRQYGNGCFVAPQADMSDGRLDVVIVQPTTLIADLWRVRRLFTRTILEDRHVRSARVASVRVSSDTPLRAQYDGEAVAGLGTDTTLAVVPAALKVCTP